MKTFLALLMTAFLLSFNLTHASGVDRPPAHVTQAVFNEAVEKFNQRNFDEAEAEFKKVISDSFRVDELLETRLKATQYLGFIDRERHDYVQSNKWFRAATVILSDYGTDDQKLRWRKVLANEISTNNAIIEKEKENKEMQDTLRKKELVFLSAFLFLSLLGLVTFIVLFTNLRKAYRNLAARNSEWAGAVKAHADTPAQQEDNTLRKKILDYVEKEKAWLDPDISLEKLCRAIGSNRSYVSAELNSMSGRFNSFINEYRIKEAIRLFTEQPELSIDEVLERCGFNARATFYTAFKEATGMSPAAFRKINRD